MNLGILNLELEENSLVSNPEFHGRVEEAFHKASIDDEGRSSIKLKFSGEVLDLTLDTGDLGARVGIPLLNSHLPRLIGENASGGSDCEIGLVFTTRHPTKVYLGYMFDHFGLVQRLGAAIFVEEILFRRKGCTQEQIMDQLVYTTVHELGHVFHLNHNKSAISYMRQSHESGVYDHDFFVFVSSQKKHLQKCDHCPDVWPGGTLWKYI